MHVCEYFFNTFPTVTVEKRSELYKYMVANSKHPELHRILMMFNYFIEAKELNSSSVSQILSSSLFQIPAKADPMLFLERAIILMSNLAEHYKYYFPKPYESISEPVSSISN